MGSEIRDPGVVAPGVRQRRELDDLPELATLAQTAEVMGLTVSQLRSLIHSRRLEHVMIGRRPFIPKSAIPRFIAQNTVEPWRDETLDHASVSSKKGKVFTSVGPKLAAAGSAARARQIAKKLKLYSPNSSDGELDPADRVIPLKSS
jgi:excisionase family DNA binding protein